MIAASEPRQRPSDAKLLVIDRYGRISHRPRSDFSRFLRRGDLVFANDAATMPASPHGTHLPTGEPIEVRLAGPRPLAPGGVFEVLAGVVWARGLLPPSPKPPP